MGKETAVTYNGAKLNRNRMIKNAGLFGVDFL